jgi:hypothetical protein
MSYSYIFETLTTMQKSILMIRSHKNKITTLFLRKSSFYINIVFIKNQRT